MGLNSRKLSRLTAESLYSHVMNDAAFAYWQHKGQISRQQIPVIHWEGSIKALSRLPFGMRRFQIKLATGHCAVGVMAQKRQDQDHSRCPRCHQPEETTLHVLRCQDPRATLQWRQSLRRLRGQLDDLGTSFALTESIIQNLTRWQTDSGPWYPYDDSGATKAVDGQWDIGWENAVRGQLHYEWAASQHRHYQSIGSRKSGNRWITALITKLVLVSWDMWEHRNGILHGPGGPLQKAAHAQADRLIDAEFNAGITTLHPSDHMWLASGPTSVKTKRLNNKWQWLASVKQARERYTDPTITTHWSFAQQQRLLATWLGRGPIG